MIVSDDLADISNPGSCTWPTAQLRTGPCRIAYKTYFRDLPTIWDETRLLAGAPGKHAILARRSGGRWWIAGINGENAAKTVALDLAGLPGLSGEALVLHDGDGFASRRIPARSARNYRAEMSAFGGFVLVFGI